MPAVLSLYPTSFACTTVHKFWPGHKSVSAIASCSYETTFLACRPSLTPDSAERHHAVRATNRLPCIRFGEVIHKLCHQTCSSTRCIVLGYPSCSAVPFFYYSVICQCLCFALLSFSPLVIHPSCCPAAPSSSLSQSNCLSRSNVTIYALRCKSHEKGTVNGLVGCFNLWHLNFLMKTILLDLFSGKMSGLVSNGVRSGIDVRRTGLMYAAPQHYAVPSYSNPSQCLLPPAKHSCNFAPAKGQR